MEESISRMSRNLASFCNNIQSSSEALKRSLDRRPIPLHSASTTFMQSLNRRVSSLACDLNLIETMSSGTVSFEELLGHCHQMFEMNRSGLDGVRDRLCSLGYLKEDDAVDEFEDDFMASTPESESKLLASYQGSTIKGLEDDSLFDESMSLQNLGLSEACLASLAAEGNKKIDVLDSPPKLRGMEVRHQDVPNIHGTVGVDEKDKTKVFESSKSILVSEDDYSNLPSYMKTLAPWEDLQTAVEKMNSFLSKKGNTKQCNFFHPEELESMGLGPKGRSYLLLLVRMKRLGVETNDGLISYRVL